MKRIILIIAIAASSAFAEHVFPQNQDPTNTAFFGQLNRDSIVVTNNVVKSVNGRIGDVTITKLYSEDRTQWQTGNGGVYVLQPAASYWLDSDGNRFDQFTDNEWRRFNDFICYEDGFWEFGTQVGAMRRVAVYIEGSPQDTAVDFGGRLNCTRHFAPPTAEKVDQVVYSSTLPPPYTPSADEPVFNREVTTIVREHSGDYWDEELQVWWTGRMSGGKLTYMATTNVNLNAEH